MEKLLSEVFNDFLKHVERCGINIALLSKKDARFLATHFFMMREQMKPLTREKSELFVRAVTFKAKSVRAQAACDQQLIALDKEWKTIEK